jgi:hypothetical protein
MADKTFQVGDGTDSSHGFEMEQGLGASNPKLRYNSTTDVWEISVDGVTFQPISSAGQIAPQVFYNSTGGQLDNGTLVYLSSFNGGQGLYQASKSIVTDSPATTFYADFIVDGDTPNSSAGILVERKILTGLNTLGLTVGRPVFLSDVAGGWLGSLPSFPKLVQIVGKVIEVNGSTGRIILKPQEALEFNMADRI